MYRLAAANLKEKLRLVKEMCDVDRDGKVNRSDFCEFVKSLNVAAGVAIDSGEQEDIIESILFQAGVDPHQTVLTDKEFEAIFNQLDGTRRPMGIHFRGARLNVNVEE